MATLNILLPKYYFPHHHFAYKLIIYGQIDHTHGGVCW